MKLRPEGDAPRRRYAVLAEGWFANRHAKTAHGLLRYGRGGPGEVVAVIDSTLAGGRVRDVIGGVPEERDAPIVSTLQEALLHEPTSLLVGLAPPGGQLLEPWMRLLRQAAEEGIEIVSGLHQRLAPELPEARVWDVRHAPEVPIFSGEGFAVEPKVALAVGTSSAVGKMTATLEVERAARERGISTEFAATGQTGVVISGWGVCVDAVVSDFVAGASEQLVLEAARTEPDLILVEGQGSIGHPAYSGVTAGLLHGSCPDCLLLCADASDEPIVPGVPRPGPAAVARIYEAVAGLVKSAPVVAVSVNTAGLDEEAAALFVDGVAAETGLPAADPFRGPAFGTGPLLDAILASPKTSPAGETGH
ncbi:DUF1611 domain-containing protein [Rubrobacter aplysinae]|uniref:DUF1611 domain-containing protein n=1 Tax=Rubrobacter aplysinae TaxID=909625 RepID=UPI00069EC158|nr:DUF1611 domain-containing protein [Rubrobacter aplysinae]